MIASKRVLLKKLYIGVGSNTWIQFGGRITTTAQTKKLNHNTKGYKYMKAEIKAKNWSSHKLQQISNNYRLTIQKNNLEYESQYTKTSKQWSMSKYEWVQP